jgi:hypothetical protein
VRVHRLGHVENEKHEEYGLRTNEPGHYAADCGGDAKQMGDRRRVEQFVLSAAMSAKRKNEARKWRTGTFRWVMTTEVSFPRTAMAVWPEPEMALKAYSGMAARWLSIGRKDVD